MTSNQNLATWKQSTVKCFNSLYFKIADLAQNKHIIAYERMREHFRDQRGAAVIYREAWASNLYSDASPFKYG